MTNRAGITTPHIGTSPLTGRIYQGRVNSAGTAFVGKKRDVTSDVLRSVIEKAEFHKGGFEIEGGGEKWKVTVTKVTSSVQQQPSAQEAP